MHMQSWCKTMGAGTWCGQGADTLVGGGVWVGARGDFHLPQATLTHTLMSACGRSRTNLHPAAYAVCVCCCQSCFTSSLPLGDCDRS